MAVRLDPFGRIVGVAWPPAGFTLPFLERVFVSNEVDFSAAPAGFGCPGGLPPSGFTTQTQIFSRIWIFHFRATPTSPVRLVQRIFTRRYQVNDSIVCVTPVNRRAESWDSVEYRQVAVGHTAAALAAFTWTEIAGAAFVIPNSENPLAWPQPDWLLTGLPVRTILGISWNQKRELFPGSFVLPPPMRWDQYALNPFAPLPQTALSTVAEITQAQVAAADFGFVTGSDTVAPGRDSSWWFRRTCVMAP